MWWLFICLWGMMNSASLQTELYFTIFFVISVEQWQKPAVQQRGFGACSRWSSWVTLLYGKSTESSLFLFYLVEGQKYKWVFWPHWKTTLGQRRQRRSYSLSWAPGVCFVPLAALPTDERAVSPAPRCAGAVLGAQGVRGSSSVLPTGSHCRSCAYSPETLWKSRRRWRSCNGGGLSSCGMFSSFSTSRFCKTWIFILITQLILILARTRKGVLWGLIDWSDTFWTQISGWIGYLMCENRRWCL